MYIWFWVFLLLLVAYVAYIILRREGLKMLAYRRYFSQPGVFEGETVLLVEEVQNPYFLPLFFVNIDGYMYNELRLKGQPEGTMQEFTSRFYLPPRTQVRRSIPIKCTKRGYYELETVYVQNKSRAAKAALFVYPRVLPFQESRSMENEMQNLAESDRRLLQDPFSFAGVREYRPGDPFRSINYKATAKTGALKVNERDYFSSRSFMLYIDFHVPEDSESHPEIMETALSYAADMVQKAINQGYNVGFAANCKKQLGREKHIRYPMRRGQEHYVEILREMAAIRISEGCSLTWLMQQDIDELYNVDIYIMTANTYDTNSSFSGIVSVLESRGNCVTVMVER